MKNMSEMECAAVQVAPSGVAAAWAETWAATRAVYVAALAWVILIAEIVANTSCVKITKERGK